MSKSAFEIATATAPQDIADCAALFSAYAGSLGVDLSYQGFAGELSELPGKYAPPHGTLLLARSTGGEAIGCVAIRPIDPAGYCEMKRLYVAPRGRGLGLGKALVEAVITEALSIGYREMRLDTLPDMAEAIALYRRLGFKDIPPYYDTPVAGTIFMALKLGRPKDRE